MKCERWPPFVTRSFPVLCVECKWQPTTEIATRAHELLNGWGDLWQHKALIYSHGEASLINVAVVPRRL